jgi:hypothetical protein
MDLRPAQGSSVASNVTINPEEKDEFMALCWAKHLSSTDWRPSPLKP